MKKSIEILEGDEYRAKVERELKEGTLFEDVYQRANDIVTEIIKETKGLRGRDDSQCEACKNFQDMSNNIVAFCSERGQGKTSAMQSFAAYLRGEMRAEGIWGKDKDFKKSDYYFEVLDSIDPSALNSGESIVRVLISRLFYKLEEDFKKWSAFDKEKDGKSIHDISVLFEQCYINIDYLCGKAKPDQGDLDFLAQLGNSAKLKRNLYDLVEACLKAAMHGDGAAKLPYLVVQIDDADLSMCDIFHICEDIRVYFSIPNVIVLMAADYEQLRYAVYQKYLKRYKNLIKLHGLLEYEKDCNEMASRYLEKMIPSGHKITLPVMERLISESYQELRVCYYHEGQDLFDREEFLVCRDIQEQVLNLLYMKTGIILLKQKEELHSFLPHTLRELTHLLKLLNEMDTVEFKSAYQMAYQEGEPDSSKEQDCAGELDKLRENLSALKEYFLKYWCGNHLDALQYKLLKDIDRENRNGQIKAVYKCISTYLQKRGKEVSKLDKETYKNLMRFVVGNDLKDEPELQMAIHLYYSIFLNEWFAAAVESPEQFENFVRFVESPFDLPDEFWNKKYRDIYYVLQFDVDRSRLEKNLSKERMMEGETVNWLENFCIPIWSDRTKGEPFTKMVEEIDGKREWNPNIKKLKFNIFQPILAMLLNRLWKDKDELEKQSESLDENADEMAVQKTMDAGYLLSVKNLVCNYEVQQYIQSKLIEICGKLPGRQRNQAWSLVCREIYQEIDSYADEAADYLREKSRIKEVCYAYLSNRDLGDVVFCCNEENVKQYVREYKESMLRELYSQTKQLSELEAHEGQDLADTGLLTLLGEDGSLKKITPQIAAMPEMIENATLKKLKRLENEWRNEYELFKKGIQNLEEGDNLNGRERQAKRIKEYKTKLMNIKTRVAGVR